jgi:hypothetical protein
VLLAHRRQGFFADEKGQVILVASEQIDGMLTTQSRPVRFPVARFVKPIGDSRRHGQHVIDGGFHGNPCVSQAKTFEDAGVQAELPGVYQLQNGGGGEHLGNRGDTEPGVHLVLDFPGSVGVAVGPLKQCAVILFDQDGAGEFLLVNFGGQ